MEKPLEVAWVGSQVGSGGVSGVPPKGLCMELLADKLTLSSSTAAAAQKVQEINWKKLHCLTSGKVVERQFLPAEMLAEVIVHKHS